MEDGQKLMRRMVRLLNQMDGVYYYLGRELGVNENTLTFLYALDDGEPHSQAEISADWFIPKTTINSIVKTMTRDGYIVLTPGTSRREKRITLTEAGRAYADQLLGRIYQAEKSAMDATLGRYSPEFVEALAYFVARFEEAYSPAPEASR